MNMNETTPTATDELTDKERYGYYWCPDCRAVWPTGRDKPCECTEAVCWITIMPSRLLNEIDGEKSQMQQCFEIAQNAAARVLAMEALVDDAMNKMHTLGDCVDLPGVEGVIFDAVTSLLDRMKRIIDGLAEFRCPNCESDNTGGTTTAQGDRKFICLDCGTKFNLKSSNPPLVVAGKMPERFLPENHPDKGR